MIRIIGVRRFIVLLVFVGANIALAVALYLYLLPEKVRLDRQLRSLQSQVSAVGADIDRMQVEFSQLDKQQERFNEIKDGGFFSIQDRSDAKNILSSIQEKSGVISAVASVKPGDTVEYAEARKANHKVLLSPIEITIKAFDDASIYRYLDIVQKNFPGHLSIDSVEIERTRDVSAPVLRAIASGSNPELVNADIKISWRTVIPESQVITGKKSP